MLRPAESASAAARPPAAFESRPHQALPFLVGTLALLAFSVVTFVHPSASRIHGWPLSAVAVALWLLPITMVAVAVARQSSWRVPSRLLLAGLGTLALATFASALFSPFSAASLPRVWPAWGGIALYLCLHHACTASPRPMLSREHLARFLAIAGVALTVVSLGYWSGGAWPLPWGARNAAPFGHSTHTAGAIVLVLPWIVLQAAGARGLLRVPWIIATAAALAVLVSTSSRGGVLALACIIVSATAAVLVLARWSRPQKLFLVLMMIGVGALVVFTNPRLRELVLNLRWSEVSRESNLQRQAMLAAGLRLGAERPLLGWGPGTIPLAYPRVRAQLDGGTENILQLHNTPVQVWATTGAAGVLAIALLLGGTTVAIARAPRTPLGFAASASLLGYGVVALTDHQLDLPAMAGFVAAGLAVLTSSNPLAGCTIQPSRLLRIFVASAIAVVVTLPPTLRDLHARQIYDSALTALGRDKPQEFIAALDRATAVTPHDPFFTHHAAAALLDQRARTSDPARQLALARDAASRLERSLATGAHQEFAHFNLGWLYLELARPTDAARHFIAAARLVPDKRGIYFGLGLANEAAGLRQAAVRCFALEVINDPRSLTSPAWELPALATLRPAVREEVSRLYASLRRDFPGAQVIETWTRWWWGEAVSPVELGAGFNSESARFPTALTAIVGGEPVPGVTAPWAQAYTAWRGSRAVTDSPPSDAFAVVAKGDRAFASALERRARQYRDDFRAFLAAPTGDEPALIRTFHHQRIGYGMLALHPEGPPLHDLYIVQENRVVADFAAGLFPAKGWLPGRFLLALLPEDSR